MPYPTAVRPYYLGALETAPAVVQELLGNVANDDPLWDFCPYPDRFTLRGAIAHMADWNPVYIERIELARDQDQPLLVNKDEGQMAVDLDYDHSDAVANVKRFAETRKDLIALVSGLAESDWDRLANRENVGLLSIGDLIGLVTMHDAYHLRQIMDYRQKIAALS